MRNDRAVEVPGGLALMSVGHGLAAGVVENEFEEQRVVVFRLVGSGAR